MPKKKDSKININNNINDENNVNDGENILNENTNTNDNQLTGISLFSGMGGDSYGMKKAGVKVIAYSEFQPVFRNTHDLNFSNCEIIGDSVNSDITKVKDSEFAKYTNKVDMLFAGFPCFVTGTKVLTNNGYKNIEDVNLDDLLLTHTGKFNKILNLQRKICDNNDLYELIINENNIIKCTEEHPFYVRNKRKVWNNENNKYDTVFSDCIWKSANKLTENDYLGMVINNNEIINNFNITDLINNNFDKNENFEYIDLNNKNIWFKMGAYIANPIDYNDNDYNNINILFSYIFNFNNNNLYNMYIPEWIQDAPKTYINEFINGYISKNSCSYDLNNSSSKFTKLFSSSYNVSYSLQRLLLKLNIISNIYCLKKYFNNNTNFKYLYTIEYNKSNNYNKYGFIENNYFWFSNYSIKKVNSDNNSINNSDNDIFVYNFEVNNDNSYIIENIIVHNCQGFSQAGKKMDDDPRNTLFKDFVRATSIIKPKYIIGENVKGLLTRKTSSNLNYIDVIVDEFKKLNYTVKYKVLKAEQYGVPQKRERLIILGCKNELVNNFKFFDNNIGVGDGSSSDTNDLKNIIKFDMTGALKVSDDFFDLCNVNNDSIITDMSNNETSDISNVHPYLLMKYNTDKKSYGTKTFDRLFSFSKRDSPIHCEIVDISKPSKTIICTYEHQPRLFVALRNNTGNYLRPFTPYELKQIQGFPEDYQLSGNLKQQTIQIGNAVPPPLIEKVVKYMLNL